MARKARPKSGSDRASASRAAKLAAGYVSKTMLLAPAAAANLAALIERDECSETEAVEAALRLARDRNSEPSNAELASMVARRLTGRRK
jgi:hypothetical protein